ncbi:MAG TPA: hypothetical protein VK655_07370 [Solirubrobacteraceae bacterium]|nr:hypothetical protein [Solirubrobacteraceae bacterium]
MQTQAPTHIPLATNLDRLLRCVSSGYLSDGCSCQKTVPDSVASAAWARQLEHTPAVEDQFFRFAWRGGEWLAYGLRDGRVRGVYCPEHNARRTERCSFGYRVGVVAS